MLAPFLLGILQDAASGQRDFTNDINNILASENKSVPKSQRFEFSKTLLDRLLQNPSSPLVSHFHAAISHLREMAPYLNEKDASKIDVIARIEKYVVKFALLVADKPANSVQRKIALSELETTLHLLFTSRLAPITARTHYRQKLASRSHKLDIKENADPQLYITNVKFRRASQSIVPNDITDVLNCMVYPGFSELPSQTTCPNNDSSLLTRLITGALILKQENLPSHVTLAQRMYAINTVLLPWLRHMETFPEPSNHEYVSVYTTRLCRILQSAANQDSCVFAKSQATVVMLSLGNIPLDVYAHDLHKTVTNLINSNKCGLLHQETLDVVVSVYENALTYVTDFQTDSPYLFSEDVSVWLDHVAYVWGRINASELPEIFISRLNEARRAGLSRDVIDCFQLQINLFNIGAYGRKALTPSNHDRNDTGDPLWSDIRREVSAIETPDYLKTRRRWSSAFPNLERSKGKLDFYLRFLRVIEPLRSTLVIKDGISVASLHDRTTILQRHLSATLTGLCLLSKLKNKEATSSKDVQKQLLGMSRMTGCAVEAGIEMVRIYWCEKETDIICNTITCVARILARYATWYKKYSQQWWNWFLNELRAFFDKKRQEMNHRRPADRKMEQTSIVSLLNHIEQSTVFYCDGPELFEARLSLLNLLRRVYISSNDWVHAFKTSVKIWSIEHAQLSTHYTLPVDSLHSFVQDLVRMVCDSSFDVLNSDFLSETLENIPMNFIFGSVTDYQCFTRTNLLSYRTHCGFLDTLYGLQYCRYFLLKKMLEKNACLLRRLHQLWLQFVFDEKFSWKEQEAKGFYEDLTHAREGICAGHSQTAPNLKRDIVTCVPFQISYLRIVVDLWRSAEGGQYLSIGKTLEDLEDLFASFPPESLSKECLILIAEILDWVSTNLVLKEQDSYAWEIRCIAEIFREILDIPKYSHSFLLNLALRMASRKKFNWYFSSRAPEVKDRSCPYNARFRMVLAELDYASTDDFVLNEGQDLFYENALLYWYGKGDITSALSCSHGALKNIMRRLVAAKDPLHCCVEEFNIGGSTVNIATNIRLDSGQAHMCELLELTNVLFQYASLCFEAEYILHGDYYMERCFKLASKCLPTDSYLFRKISFAYHAKMTVRGEEPINILQDHLNNFDANAESEASRNGVMEQEMLATMGSLRYRHEGAASASEALQAIDMCEKSISRKENDNNTWVKRINTETTILKAVGTFHCGELERTVKLLNSVSKCRTFCKAPISVQHGYVMARSLWKLKRESKSERKTVTTRSTRSRSRCRTTTAALVAINEKMSSDAVKEVERAIEECTFHMSEDFDVPWICRRVHGLQTLKVQLRENATRSEIGEHIAILAQKIGASYNVRWRFERSMIMKRNISRNTHDAGSTEQLKTLFGKMSIDEMKDLYRLLDLNNCVVVGINIDHETEKLILWRISGTDVLLKLKSIPSDGPSSLEGVCERIRKIVSNRRNVLEGSNENLTNKEKSDWWAERFRQDEEIHTIVEEIEDKWIGDADYIFGGTSESCPSPVNGSEQVILLVDTELERIPWESVGPFRERMMSVTRCPSLAFLKHHLQNPLKELDSKDMFYVINPTGEFVKTEGRFNDLTKSQGGWSGFCGKCSVEDVKAKYNGQRVYMYCGHGTGTAFFSPRRFEKGNDAPVTLLMGCSSATPSNVFVKDEESNGAAIDFLIRGAPAVVGTLWDVSDGEIDRFTLSLLSLWAGAEIGGPKGERVSLAEAVARSRSACRTPFLVGAACVVLGAPNIRVKTTK